jgi:hypothetical protein
LEDENSLGSLLRTVWTIPMDLSVWWLVSHRYRLLVSLLGRLISSTDAGQTFGNYPVTGGLSPTLRREARIFGYPAVFGSGLFYDMIADELEMLRSRYMSLRRLSNGRVVLDKDSGDVLSWHRQNWWSDYRNNL